MKDYSGSNSKEVLFFTCATGFYRDFILPYIYFAQLSNPEAAFEILVDNLGDFEKKHSQSIKYLREKYNLEILIRAIPHLEVRPKMNNSYRFIVEPVIKREYVYIGDIDIMILENVLDKHLYVFEKGLPYSNIVRVNSKKLTGLHFCKYDKQYPLPNINDLIGSIFNDEDLLYAIMDRKGMIYLPDEYRGIQRPVHGIHMSLNRMPFSYHLSRVDWGVEFFQMILVKKILESEDFKSFFDSSHVSSRMILMNILIICLGVLELGQEKYSTFTNQRVEFLSNLNKI